MKTFRDKILIGVALTLFTLMGMISNSAAETITLPDPTQYYPDGTPGLSGQNYVAWAHDDFWSYGAQLIYANQKNNPKTYFPTDTYGSFDIVTGSGTLAIIVENQNGMANPSPLPNAVKEKGGISQFHDVWGLGSMVGPNAPLTNPMAITYPSNNVPATVGNILTNINPAGASNMNIPVFGLDLQDAGSVPILLSGQVYLWDSVNQAVYVDPITGQKALWALDNIAQGTGYSGSQRGPADVDWPGFSINGNYDPEAYGAAIVFPGGGHVDYLAYAPTMDLSKYPSTLLFVTDFTVIDTNEKTGNTEVFILSNVATSQVPEPATVLLLGLGLVGLAGVGRKFRS